MSKLIYIVLGIAIFCAGFAFGVAGSDMAYKQSPVDVYVDPVTGVNYLINARTGGMCVRLNSNDTLMVDDIK